MGNTLAQPILRVVPPLTNQGDSPQTPVPVVPPLSGAAPPPPSPPPPPADSAAPAGEPPIEYPPAPDDILTAVRAFYGPADTTTTTMTASRFPVSLGHALEALKHAADGTKQHTVAAMLDRGLRLLHRFPGVTECLEGRQALLLHNRDLNVHAWLEQLVAVDLPTAGLGYTRFPVRVALAQHRQIGVLAAGLGLPLCQCFTLALTAALVGSRFVAMDAANEAMVRTMFDFGARCKERARYTEKLLSVPQPASTTIRRTIDDVLGGRGE